ncbi:MAG TPA: pentapeptide repeat-containing protein [Candidatus Brocadiia bacterium]|nr:pentapeptide repeat-containing protein [Candidatus Brocadiales bacterium]
MANEEHLKILRQGVDVWNRWREENPEIVPDLRGANLIGMDLCIADLSMGDLRMANLNEANLCDANLRDADLFQANLSNANLSYALLHRSYLIRANCTKADFSNAELNEAHLTEADLTGAKLSGATLFRTNLWETNCIGANLTNANLVHAQLIETNFERATLTNCRIYGISAWNLKLKDAIQSNLVITPAKEPTITVDNLEVAQFIYLLLYNEKIRHVIDTITSKVVLILGRFTEKQMKVLDAIKKKLRKHKNGYVPVVFNFKKPGSQTFIETVSTLAHLARFVIADFTRAKIVLEEIPHIVRNVTVPVKPLMKGSGKEPITLYNLRINHRSLLETYRYKNLGDLLASFKEKVIIPAEAKVTELKEIKAKELLKLKK